MHKVRGPGWDSPGFGFFSALLAIDCQWRELKRLMLMQECIFAFERLVQT
jgi:hypothetical protein